MNDESIGSLPANISTLLEAAVNLHEVFVTLMAGGFNEPQALYIVSQVLRPQKD